MSNRISVAVAGATGYAGIELVRWLQQHPKVRVGVVSSQSYVGRPLSEVYPHLLPYTDQVCREQEIECLLEAEAIFLALPAGHAGAVAQAAVAAGRKVIDLGADLRLKEAEAYRRWYGLEPPAAEVLVQAVYGLPEINREQIASASVVANPGCYPTGALLALAPVVREGWIEPDSIVIDAKSGVTGAGRSLNLATLYCEVNEGLHPYQVGNHRHTPEIEQELARLAGEEIKVTFVPHLVPMSRGILSTVYARLKPGISLDQVRALYAETYRDEPFVHLLPPGTWPHTRWVYGSNHCFLALGEDSRTGRLILASAIDNLVKGAAGQAIQNLNLMFGWEEGTGLETPPLYP
ncbi:MAG: N-acetyl-gamma-glutamyl-phosphate reductase [Clostridia bacterium]|jgi:N-acetyl-gamma-glutamyl-phosphate reductase|nr:N-acetyl-gamma-glutamyl-phosphate reductase [Clostridia bacterium]MDH7572021.1 N-acetyl-gamma-glutamyl-phosphate reductase [Clostridia bacterium]